MQHWLDTSENRPGNSHLVFQLAWAPGAPSRRERRELVTLGETECDEIKGPLGLYIPSPYNKSDEGSRTVKDCKSHTMDGDKTVV